MTDLTAVQGVWIDGKRYEYRVHKNGLRKGTLHTVIGDFGSLEEMIAYVRGRNSMDAQDSSGGEASGKDNRFEHWPGVYNPS